MESARIWRARWVLFQSSTYRGRHCNDPPSKRQLMVPPLFQSSTYRGRHCNCDDQGCREVLVIFQSSTYRGRHCNRANCSASSSSRLPFQSSTYRGRHCNDNGTIAQAVSPSLSVLYLSRKALQPGMAQLLVDSPRPFSPLLIEEGTATPGQKLPSAHGFVLSVLYLSRKALQPPRSRSACAVSTGTFSPLLIEEGTATAIQELNQ